MDAKINKAKTGIRKAKLLNTNLLKKQERDDIIHVLSEKSAGKGLGCGPNSSY
jgi:hypothetical protein